MEQTDQFTCFRNSRFVVTTILVTLIGFLLRLLFLSSQPVSPDDFAVGLSAINFVEFGQPGPTMWFHPNLRNILIYGSMGLFGTGVVGIKGVSLVFGTLCIPLISLVARRMLKDATVAVIAAFLWSIEPLAIDFSRQAINDICLAFFPLAAIYCIYRSGTARNVWWLAAGGISFGLGLASKVSVLFPLMVTCGLLLLNILKGPKDHSHPRSVAILSGMACLVVLPLMVYFLTFAPWFGRGYSIAEWPVLQKSMLREMYKHTGFHSLEQDNRDHWAYEWFIRPVTYVDTFANSDGVPGIEPAANTDGKPMVTILLSVANPLVWLLVIPATVFIVIRGVRARAEGACYLAALFLCSYLPMAFAGRPIWVDTALSVLPFALISVAYFICNVVSSLPARKKVLSAYIVLVTITTIPLYFLAIGKEESLPILGAYLSGHASKGMDGHDR